MKILLILFTLFTSLIVKAQTSVYHPFPTNNGCWTYRYWDDFHNPTSQLAQYILYGDTNILGVNYKKISGGAIRESNKIIYFVPDTSVNEYVLYNFNLGQGDTLFHPFGYSMFSDTVIVNYVDSVNTSNGYLRQIHFGMITWIEGVGSNFYLLNPLFVLGVSGNFQLECMQGDSGGVYPGTSCFYCPPVGLSKIISTKEISLSPNPFHYNALLTIKSSNFRHSELKIYNVLGEELKYIHISDLETIINRDGIPNGIYFYSITNSENKTICGKFITE